MSLKENNLDIDLSEVPDELFQLEVDESILKRIFSNLFNNSIEAMENRSHAKINVKLFKEMNRLIIVIIDNGRGMFEEVLSQLGTKNFSHGKESTARSGSGLGVYHAKNALAAICGELKFESNINVGTCVTLTIPFS